LCKGVAETVEIAETADELVPPFIENERTLHRLLLKDGVEILYADDQTTHHYATVFRQLRKQGTPIATNDMWLAALVLQHNLALHARDRHFDADRARLTATPHLRQRVGRGRRPMGCTAVLKEP
jgi:predicted nucleic acid-binding protein